jgi:septal ring factor EnvC (AmiA/AmiB activator)
VHFADAKGLLTRPVSGDELLGFGDQDGLGGESQGLSVATRPGTPVLAPVDGWVVYAGPFRSYGQVLILNAGDGYHIVLAGMERIDAALGQFVLGGEPVATMGATRLASIGEVEHTSAQPILYVEFRKDGTAIDSAPWWTPTDGEVNG